MHVPRVRRGVFIPSPRWIVISCGQPALSSAPPRQHAYNYSPTRESAPVAGRGADLRYCHRCLTPQSRHLKSREGWIGLEFLLCGENTTIWHKISTLISIYLFVNTPKYFNCVTILFYCSAARPSCRASAELGWRTKQDNIFFIRAAARCPLSPVPCPLHPSNVLTFCLLFDN